MTEVSATDPRATIFNLAKIGKLRYSQGKQVVGRDKVHEAFQGHRSGT